MRKLLGFFCLTFDYEIKILNTGSVYEKTIVLEQRLKASLQPLTQNIYHTNPRNIGEPYFNFVHPKLIYHNPSHTSD